MEYHNHTQTVSSFCSSRELGLPIIPGIFIPLPIGFQDSTGTISPRTSYIHSLLHVIHSYHHDGLGTFHLTFVLPLHSLNLLAPLLVPLESSQLLVEKSSTCHIHTC